MLLQASNASKPSHVGGTSGTQEGDQQAELLQVQEKLNRLLVSYLSSSHTSQHGLVDTLQAEDPSPISQDARFETQQARVGYTRGGSDVTLNRKSQIILLSLFGLLVAYPQVDQYMPQLPAALTLSAHASILASIWRATPPVLVATGLATIWARGASLPTTQTIAATHDVVHEQLESLYLTIKSLVQAMSAFDSQIGQVLRLLQTLEETALQQSLPYGDAGGLPAQNVRQALLDTLTNAEIAAKVALDGVKQKCSADSAVLDTNELDRLIGMYASATATTAASLPISPMDMHSRRQSMSPQHHHQADQSARSSILWQDNEAELARSPDRTFPLRSPPHSHHQAHTPGVLRTSMQRRRSRPKSWAAASPLLGTPNRAASTYVPSAEPNMSIMSVLDYGGVEGANPSPGAENMHLPGSSTPKRKVLNRRQSDQLPSLALIQRQRNSVNWQRQGLGSILASPPAARLDLPASADMRTSKSAEAACTRRRGSTAPEEEDISCWANNSADSSFATPTSIAAERAKTLERMQSHNPTVRPSTGRSRPSSMYELDFARLQSTGSPAGAPRRLSLSPIDLASRGPADDGRRWSAHAHVYNHNQAASGRRSRPASLMLEGLSSLGSPPALSGRSSQVQPRAEHRYGVNQLLSKRQDQAQLCRELLCILLALRWPGGISNDTRQLWHRMHSLFESYTRASSDLVKTLRAERSSLQQALEKEFGKEGIATIAPMSPYASAGLRTLKSDRPTLHRRSGGLQIRFPGSFPSSPIIELDPATPSPDEDTFLATSVDDEAMLAGRSDPAGAADFAPREPLSAQERKAKVALMASLDARRQALSSAAAKLYLQRSQVESYFREVPTLEHEQAESRLHSIISTNESARQETDVFIAEWNDSRVALRQLQAELDRKQSKVKIPLGNVNRDVLYASSTSSQTPDLVGDLPSSTSLGKRDSTASTLSTTSGTDGDHLATPATSPHTGPDFGQSKRGAVANSDISQLLLDQTNPRHLPPPGLEEQLFEAFSGSDDRPTRPPGGASSREERIALARQRRKQQEDTVADVPPPAQSELVSELKDVMAILRYACCIDFASLTDQYHRTKRKVIPVSDD